MATSDSLSLCTWLLRIVRGYVEDYKKKLRLIPSTTMPSAEMLIPPVFLIS
ncbi:MAG: hypothetical protein WCB90_05790 [Methanosarcina sp.]